MSLVEIRAKFKSFLPRGVRGVLRGLLHYFQRLGRWPIILWQVRGMTFRDEINLLLSAFAAPLTAAKNLQSWQDPVLLWDTGVNVPKVGKFELRARSDDLWHVLPWREREILRILNTTLKQGDVFVDAGANIGIYSVLASRLVGENGSVIAVEMMPDTASRLRRNLAANGIKNVEIFQVALAERDESGAVARVTHGKFGQASILRNEGAVGSSEVKVKTRTLDSLLGHLPYVSLMKMDLEGAELQALGAATAVLGRTEQLIYESNGFSKDEVDAISFLLIEAGFRIRNLDGNNRLARMIERPRDTEHS